jgi:2-phospho-L-lactate/phosphoenolpyruvate guanylyltransferase
VRIAAIIPVANLEGAKTRLGETLDAEERHDLVTGLMARTVVTALAAPGLEDVLVVSPDREVLTRAAELGARTLRQRSRGLNAGVRDGRDDAVAGDADAILVLPIDLPFVSDAAIGAVLAPLVADAVAPIVVLVTDRHGTGTNALVLRPPDVIDVAFGPGSRARHRDRAEAVGASYIEIAESPLSVDLDTPEDLVLVTSNAPERLGVG